MRHQRIIDRAGAAAAGLLLLAVGACDFIEPTRDDPNVVGEATLDQLFTGIQVNTFYLAESQLSRISSIWTQQMAGTDRQFASLDQYVFTEEEADTEWGSFYIGGGLIDAQTAIEAAEEAGRPAYAGILKVYHAWQMGMAASIFGDIPFSEANDPEIDEPALDDQAQVYADVQAILDEAIADLAAADGGGPGAVDLNFAGDTEAWTEVAHTLKARFHMHWGELDEDAAYEAAIAEAENGISSPDNNWVAVHSSASTENNLWYQFMRDRSGYISSGDYLVPLMNNGTPADLGDDDPRIGIYFSLEDDGYVPRTSVLAEDDGFGAPDWNVPIVSCAENHYILAEAHFQVTDDATARAAAQEALACQEDLYDVDLSAYDAALAAATGADLLEEIMEQKYIALFLNIEAYNDYKRTCLPAITPKEAEGVPGRLFYGQQERVANPNIPPPSQQPDRNDNDPNPCP